MGDARQRWAKFARVWLHDKIGMLKGTLVFAHSGASQYPLSGPEQRQTQTAQILGEGQLQLLYANFDPPGDLREQGPRHDNDEALIKDISVQPTAQEIGSGEPPYVPYNFIGAPHHLEAGTPEHLLDTHFRLFREELVEPLRTSMMALCGELEALSRGKNQEAQLSRLLQHEGGRYKPEGNNASELEVWGDGNLNFSRITPDDRLGILVQVGFHRRHQSAATWGRQLDRHLNWGALVAVLLCDEDSHEVEMFFGLVRSDPKELLKSIRGGQQPFIKIAFFEQRAVHLALQEDSGRSRGLQVLAEVRGVLYESVSPFLHNLQRIPPSQLPFASTLAIPAIVPQTQAAVSAPRYAQVPGFSFDLSGLLRTERPADLNELRLSIDEDNDEIVRDTLKEHGIVDHTQADAVVDALSREVAIIQGPPGTGKSYTGVAIINALLKSNVGPILIVCMTNHALDSVLTKVLDSNLTKRMVRLGTRSKDERISSYNLDALVAVQGKMQDRQMGRSFRSAKLASENIVKTIQILKRHEAASEDLLEWVETVAPIQADSIVSAPAPLFPYIKDSAQFVKPTGGASKMAIAAFEFWRYGMDIKLRQKPVEPPRPEPPQPAMSLRNRFEVLTVESDPESDVDSISSWPCDAISLSSESSQRSSEQDAAPSSTTESEYESVAPQTYDIVAELPEIVHRGGDWDADDDDDDDPIYLWTCAQEDRDRLVQRWSDQIRAASLSSFDDVCREFDLARQDVLDHRHNERTEILRNSEIIGATTSGAAKAADLLKTIQPKVVLVEEAGQVLEAHILAVLGYSVQHLILIGDHKQLRPQVTYGLSMENKRGRGHLHRLDLSMMERLAEESRLPVSRIVTQRRMRPEICDIIRPVQELEDHDSVVGRENVRGLDKNMSADSLFFLHHTHPESVHETSRTNEYEADMAVDLVRHLVNQGYRGPDDIVIIVAYLSQISQIKERLLRHEITLVVSEKDATALADVEQGENAETTTTVVQGSLAAAVRVATVDNFQGEEAKIVILSLVRNSGTEAEDDLARTLPARRPGIGFLKSVNRAYVALSRARDGLFIFGNAELLRYESPFWDEVLTCLEEKDAIVEGIPISCSRHPEKAARLVSEPGQLELISPNGGCEDMCNQMRPCGHLCVAKCHPGDFDHVLIPCLEHCSRLLDCGHPCRKRCGEKCGPCNALIAKVELPCGHTVVAAPCVKVQAGTVHCTALVPKTLECGHTVTVECSVDEHTLICAGVKTDRHAAQDPASTLQPEQAVVRAKHVSHECLKKRDCGHVCEKKCDVGHQCAAECPKQCLRRLCDHLTCRAPCKKPCQVCLAKCAWQCEHGVGECGNPCGVPCQRLPCDRACTQMLSCGHPCPRICGEPCEQQTCAQCAPDDKKAQVADLLMQTTLAEVQPGDTLDSRTITLGCGHVFTVETLDGLFQLETFYKLDSDGSWKHQASLPSDFFSTFRCPYCNQPATAMRYGRPCKRAHLDDQERKFAVAMQKDIALLDDETVKVDIDELVRVFQHGWPDLPQQDSRKGPKQKKKAARKDFTFKQAKILLRRLNGSAMPAGANVWSELADFGISNATADAWRAAAKQILDISRSAERVLNQQNPLVKAWQAAVTNASWRIHSSLDPEDVRRDETARNLARAAVAMPEPKSQQKFHLLAFFVLLNCRMLLTSLAMAVEGDARKKGDEGRWFLFIEMLLESGVQDAQKAIKLADKSMYGKLAFQAQAYRVRFKAKVVGLKLERSILKLKDEQKMLEWEDKARSELDQLRQEWARQMRTFDEDKSLKSNLDELVSTALAELADPTTARRQRQQRKMEQKMIVRTLRQYNMDLSHGGHWYRCTNGHPFLIGDCGGAMQVSRCPECKAPIGGAAHSLLSGNTRDAELEALAAEDGAEASPFAWGRN